MTPNKASNDQTLHQLFIQQVARTPNKIAVVFEDEQLTYQQLNAKANQLAHHLQTLGVTKPNTLVAIACERSTATIVGILGILKAGAAYVPLDPAYPAERIRLILEDTQAAILLTQQAVANNLPKSPVKLVLLDEEAEAFSHHPTLDPASSSQPEDLAYVIYTSGSTGKPKGTLIPHSNVHRLFSSTADWFHFSDKDTWALFHSFSFDFSVWEIWGALLFGGQLVIVPYLLTRSPDAFYQLLIDTKITILNQTPSAFYQLITYEDSLSVKGNLSLRKVILGGEALDIKKLVPWFRIHDDKTPQVVNMYGITEVTVHVTYAPIAKEHLKLYGHLSLIGRPIPDLKLHILDDKYNPTPTGVVGELFVSGPGLAKGYLNRTELTAERFIPNPFQTEEDKIAQKNQCLYKTGDLCRWLADGNLEYVKRCDDQVKIRGFRIELKEIETALLQHPSVKDAVVLPQEDRSGDKRLAGYVVLSPIDFQTSYAPMIVESWQEVYNDIYLNAQRSSTPLDFKIDGWDSSYTGRLIPELEMQEWLAHTTRRILELKPTRVLEIGCGAGLLISKIAPHCETYWATDFSSNALECIEHLIKHNKKLSHVKTFVREATDFSEIENQSFDLVILNSVIQFFPNIHYLIKVLKSAAKVLSPNGCIFVGDVRNLKLLEIFHTSLKLFSEKDSISLKDLHAQIAKNVQEEEELLIDPLFFHHIHTFIPELKHSFVRLKEGKYANELNDFRYDVVCFREKIAINSEINWQEWGRDFLELETLEALLMQKRPSLIAIKHIPNARIAYEAAMLNYFNEKNYSTNTMGDFRHYYEKSKISSYDPTDFLAIANRCNYHIHLNWSDERIDVFDALLFPMNEKGFLHFFPSREIIKKIKLPDEYANLPLKDNKFTIDFTNYLKNILPEYMVPSFVIPIDFIPLTLNGKLDKAALPTPKYTANHDCDLFTTNTEKSLSEIWKDVLNVEAVGITDNFFNLGGHSLLATQVLSRVRSEYSIELSFSDFFNNATVSALATLIDRKINVDN